MKSTSQKEAKKRRKEKARELRVLGMQAEDLLAEAKQKVESAEEAKESLRKELVRLRSDHGSVTAELAEAKRDNLSLTVLLDGLRSELKEADGDVTALKLDKEALTSRVAALEAELTTVKEADSDAKSLRSRLAASLTELERIEAAWISDPNVLKSQEISDLRIRLNRAVTELAEERRSKPLTWGKPVPDAKQEA